MYFNSLLLKLLFRFYQCLLVATSGNDRPVIQGNYTYTIPATLTFPIHARKHAGTCVNTKKGVNETWTRRERDVNAGTLAWTRENWREHGVNIWNYPWTRRKQENICVNKPETFVFGREHDVNICNKPWTWREHLQMKVNMF